LFAAHYQVAEFLPKFLFKQVRKMHKRNAELVIYLKLRYNIVIICDAVTIMLLLYVILSL